jgi:thymidylate synthase
MKQYLELVTEVLEKGEKKEDRTGVGTVSIFGMQKKYDLREGFPLVTTKKVNFDAIAHELIWFLSGDTNIRYLVTNGVNIWNEWSYQIYLEENNLVEKYPRYSKEWKEHMKEFVGKVIADEAFAKQWGELGPIYGKQWRRWEGKDGVVVDQIQNVLDMLKKDPSSRRILVSGWNVAELQELIKDKNHAPPPCHTLFQFYSINGFLDCQLYQRSADIALGVPFNIASYSLLLAMIAQECNLTPRFFVHTIGDAHIYLNHLDGLNEQLKRTPHKLPKLTIAKKPFWDIKFDDIQLENYIHNDFIKFPIAV